MAVPSEEWGEAVGIAVVCRSESLPPAEEELRSLIKNRLRSSRVPEHILFLTQLPYNEMGKVLRREVRSLFKAQLPG